MSWQETREAVRRTYDYRCGYCGVHENEAGSGLEIDHFQPRSIGGSDELANLVYCCSTCNKHKGDYWPTGEEYSLLHPQRDEMTSHLRLESDGRMTALTKRGIFHLERLRLNRPPLVALRRARLENDRLRQELSDLRLVQERMREQLIARDKEIESILAQLAQLLES